MYITDFTYIKHKKGHRWPWIPSCPPLFYKLHKDDV